MLKEQSMCVVLLQTVGKGGGGTAMKMQEIIKTTFVVSAMGRTDF
jgi:hypothetical protein